MTKIEVNILGHEYTIKGDEPEEYLIELANYVDKKVKSIHNNYPKLAPLNVTILAALDIADELHKTRNEHELITNEIEAKTEALSTLFD